MRQPDRTVARPVRAAAGCAVCARGDGALAGPGFAGLIAPISGYALLFLLTAGAGTVPAFYGS